MSLDQSRSTEFVQRFSIWKIVCIELLLITGAVLPLTPHFSNGLYYTSFLYNMPFFIVLSAACLIFGVMALAILPLLRLAILKIPVLYISRDSICISVLRQRCVRKKDILSITYLWPGGNVNLKIRGERPLSLPIFFYEDSHSTKEKLDELKFKWHAPQ